MELLPNLGAEEGNDWHAVLNEPRVREAARLWSHLFSQGARFRLPTRSSSAPWASEGCDETWPVALGPRPTSPVFTWLEESNLPTAWLNTRSLDRTVPKSLGARLGGPAAECVALLHDKRFAIETAQEIGLVPRTLEPLIQVLSAEMLRTPDELIDRLDSALRQWPDWTGGRFTLKPRHGSSGRGRVAGSHSANTQAVRGALPRLAARGGAIFEPWLARQIDLSVALHVPSRASESDLPTLLGSLEMLATASGVYRGHCGEVDSRGRVFSGHPDDETLRADAAAVANRARDLGFSGPCGVDAFVYREAGRERLRSLVEFNARSTMGLVTIGLVRRALPRMRKALDLGPGARRAFLLAFVRSAKNREQEQLVESSGDGAFAIDLATVESDSETRPVLVFAHDRALLRRAHLEILGC